MPARNFRQQFVTAQLLTPSFYTANTNTASFDLAPYSFAQIDVCMVSVTGAASDVFLQDSDDGVIFANVENATYEEAVATINANRRIMIDKRDVRRYCRLRIVPNGGSFNAAVMVILGPPENGVVLSTQFEIDTNDL